MSWWQSIFGIGSGAQAGAEHHPWREAACQQLALGSVFIFFSYISQDHLARVGTHCGAHRTVWWRWFLTQQSLFPNNTGLCHTSTPLLKQQQRSLCPVMLVQLIVHSCSSGGHVWIASPPDSPPSVVIEWRNALSGDLSVTNSANIMDIFHSYLPLWALKTL